MCVPITLLRGVSQITLQRHLYAHVFKHKELGASKTPLTLVANNRKPAILHGQILATHPSDVVGITGIVVHNKRGDGRLSHITEAPSASPSDRRLAKGEQCLLPRGWRLLWGASFC